MNKPIATVTLILFSPIWGGVCAAAEHPGGPLVLQNRSAAAWQVAHQYKKPEKDESAEAGAAQEISPVPARSRVEVMDGRRREIVAWSDGRRTENWFSQGREFVDAGGGRVAILDTGNQSSSFFGGYADFPELTWVNLRNFAGEETIGGKVCHVFRESVDEAAGAEDQVGVGNLFVGKRAAWIDAETRLPVVLLWEGGRLEYRHLEPPTALPEMPAHFEAAWARIQKRLDRAKMYNP